MKLFLSKRRVVAAAAVILLLLFLFRPGASRLKSRIASSISSGVGRPAEVGSVHLRLLPRPGFDLENLVVYDDPAFGAEPMLRAGEVSAALRLTSLVRGRLEIARLDLTEPSLNLVHGENGRWNLEALLERTARMPLAPTGKARSEPRPAFPYIQATSARINFKSGPEKKPYALTNADFSLWQDSENAWGVRLKAQPFRADLNLSDTGILQVNGTWQRAAVLRDTPLAFNLEWDRAQLGQLTKLFTGNDQGWRGGVRLGAVLTGTPAKLLIATNASLEGFRRYDIASLQPLHMAAHCDAQYSSLDHTFHEVACNAPVGVGLITLKGSVGFPDNRYYDLVLAAKDVPASAAINSAQRTKKNLPGDLVAGGTVNGSFSLQRTDTAFQLEGQGEIAGFRLASAASKAEIGPETIPFRSSSGGPEGPLKLRGVRQGLTKAVAESQAPGSPRIEFGPFSVAAGHGAFAVVRGWINRAGYNVSVAGETEIVRVLRVARMLGIPAMQTSVEGAAQLDLQIAGTWAMGAKEAASGFPGARVTGTAKLRNVRIAVRGAGGPIEISSADMLLAPDDVRIEKLSAKAAGVFWNGSLAMPRGCGTPKACQIRFSLNASPIAWSELMDWASPRPAERPWYRVLDPSPQTGPSVLASLRAAGRLTAEKFQMRTVTATHVSANLNLDSGKLAISELSADFLGGKYRGAWQADFTVKPGVCSGSGTLAGVSLVRLAEAMRDPWIAGTASASYELKGPCTAEFWQSAEGSLQFDAGNGSLSHISLADGEGSLKITRLVGQARLHGGEFTTKDARLDSQAGKFQVSGTASLKRRLELKLARIPNGTAGYTITGTLAAPRVAPLPGTEQAQLKPEDAK